MLAILFVGLVAACAAAPRFHHGPPPFHPQPMESRPSFFDPDNDFFDTRQFWAEMANEMREIDTMLQQFYRNFPVISSSQGLENGQYKITIPLSGFQEKEIVVKAREGVLMVQAVHKMQGGGESSYLDIKTLPSYVNVTGTWQFEEGVLKIAFPVKQDAVDANKTVEEKNEEVTEEVPVTEHSREEMATREDDNADVDADIGARGDQDNSNRELFTNEIPHNNVEATTYSVDLNDEIEFVPVRYQQRNKI